MRPSALLFGVPIDDLTLDETMETIGDLVDDGRRRGRSHQIATVNVDFLVNALADADLRTLLQDTAVNVADGLPVVWSMRLAGFQIRERVAGVDLVSGIVAESSRRGWRVHFFGSAPGVAERAVDLLRTRHPAAVLSGTAGPFISDAGDAGEAVLDEIASHDPDILCVALGNPKQEWFIAAHRDRLRIPVMMGIGGSLDMIVGDRRRAPVWVQRSGIEWLFRATQEPRRLGKRYARDALIFAPQVTLYLRDLRRHRRGPGLSVGLDGAAAVISGTSDSTESLDDLARSACQGGNLSVSFSDGTPNPRALAVLVALMRLTRRSGGAVTVVDVSSETRSELAALAAPRWIDCGFAAAGS
jgi:N-acetylglucosaminyldiphosphoundecaprenol N-acetyl-beta-D-mannosaminyltransferase